MFNYPESLITFGLAGHDLIIMSKANENTRSYSYLGNSYKLPAGIIKDSPEAYSYLAGSQFF